jgi:hypothetical protein
MVFQQEAYVEHSELSLIGAPISTPKYLPPSKMVQVEVLTVAYAEESTQGVPVREKTAEAPT